MHKLIPWSNEKSNKVCLRVVVLRNEHLVFKLLIGRPAMCDIRPRKLDTYFYLILGSEKALISVEGSLIDLDLDGNLTIIL